MADGLPEGKLTAPTFLMLEEFTIVSNLCQRIVEEKAECRMKNADCQVFYPRVRNQDSAPFGSFARMRLDRGVPSRFCLRNPGLDRAPASIGGFSDLNPPLAEIMLRAKYAYKIAM
jgi:hypothetical protein